MSRSPLIPILLLMVGFGSLFGLAQSNYLLFHVLVELSCVVIAACGFVVLWFGRANIQNGFFLIFGGTLLPVAGLTLLHALAYKGMGVFQGMDPDPATQLWIASRGLLAGSMAVGAIFLGRRPKPWLVLCLGSLAALALGSSILLIPVFPSCFVEGQGLTSFKIWAEYGICGLLGMSAWLLWKARERFEAHVLRALLAASGMGVASEMSFTLYSDVYGLMNLVGHLFAVGLFGLLLQALVRVGIQRPQDLLLRELSLREEALRSSEALFSAAFRANPEAMVIFRLKDGSIQEVNRGFLDLTGYAKEEVLGRTGEELGLWVDARERMAFMGILARHGFVRDKECAFRLRSGEIRVAQLSAEVLEVGGELCSVTVARDITEQRKSQEGLRKALQETKTAELKLEEALSQSRQREREVGALLGGARTVLETTDLTATMRSLYESCKLLVGAKAGYVSLLSREGDQMELIFLDSGGEDCQVPPETPMPIRGLRAQAMASKAPVIENDFRNTPFPGLLPPGHQELRSVLFVPLMVQGKVMGLLGLANKPGGFTELDAGLAMAFGELGAVALQNSRNLETLREREEQLRSLVDTAQDAIVSVDSRGLIVMWNPAAQRMFGYECCEILGKPLEILVPERFREAHRRGLSRAIEPEGTMSMGRTLEVLALSKQGVEFPVELSLAKWRSRGESFFTGIIRDVTERRRAQEAIKKAQEELEENVVERTAELARANQALLEEIAWRSRVEEQLQSSQEELKRLSAAILSAQEKERKQLAREIHDSVGQILAAVKFATERALLELPGSEGGVRPVLEDVVAMVQGAIEEVRRIQMDLRPAVLDDLGLLATIGWFCREFQKVYQGIQVERRLQVEEQQVPDGLKIVIFRVLQEAMNNAAKHSGADRVVVGMVGGDSELSLWVEDNGKGMDLGNTASAVSHGRMGILSMRERVELSGGSFFLESEPGKGTRVGGRWSISEGGDTETRRRGDTETRRRGDAGRGKMGKGDVRHGQHSQF
jgi:PAS domain S-box-containing protein